MCDELCSITEQFHIQKVGENPGLHPAKQHSTGACLEDYITGQSQWQQKDY